MAIKESLPKLIYADHGYTGDPLKEWMESKGLRLEIIGGPREWTLKVLEEVLALKKVREGDKPDSVLSHHSSRRLVAKPLMQSNSGLIARKHAPPLFPIHGTTLLQIGFTTPPVS